MAEAVDVDAVMRWLREAGLTESSDDADVPRTAVFSVRRYSDEAEGTTPWVRAVESDFPGNLAEELAEEILRTLPQLSDPAAATDPEEEERADPPLPLFRLHVEAAARDAALLVGPATSCRPALVNGPEVQSLLNPLGPRFPGGGRVVVDLFVGEDGGVSRHSLRQGTSNRALNEALVGVARQMRFRPAAIDGYPVGVWVRMPVRLEVVRR